MPLESDEYYDEFDFWCRIVFEDPTKGQRRSFFAFMPTLIKAGITDPRKIRVLDDNDHVFGSSTFSVLIVLESVLDPADPGLPPRTPADFPLTPLLTGSDGKLFFFWLDITDTLIAEGYNPACVRSVTGSDEQQHLADIMYPADWVARDPAEVAASKPDRDRRREAQRVRMAEIEAEVALKEKKKKNARKRERAKVKKREAKAATEQQQPQEDNVELEETDQA